MNILVFSKLSISKLNSKMAPFAESELIDNIYISREKKGKEKNKITYITLPSIIKNIPWVKHFFRILLVLIFLKKNNIKIQKILSIHLYPHGYLGFFLGKLLGVGVIQSIIAGDREIYLFGSLISKSSIYILNNSHRVIVMSGITRNKIISMGVRKHKISIIPNSIDTQIFRPIQAKKIYDIVVHTRFNKIKRIDKLVDIISRLSTKNYNLRICIMGSGPQYNKILEYSKRKDVLKNISFVGRISQLKIPFYLNKGKIFVLTSDFEGTPQALLEAMACGLACIAPEVGDIGDIINDNINGLLVSGSLNSYIEATEKLLNNKNLRSKLSSKAERHIIENYDFRTTSIKWTDTLESI